MLSTLDKAGVGETEETEGGGLNQSSPVAVSRDRGLLHAQTSVATGCQQR